jgi:hypothetical protein
LIFHWGSALRDELAGSFGSRGFHEQLTLFRHNEVAAKRKQGKAEKLQLPCIPAASTVACASPGRHHRSRSVPAFTETLVPLSKLFVTCCLHLAVAEFLMNLLVAMLCH